MTASRFNAIILAGQRPGGDPLAEAFGQRWKALIDVAGEPMLSRVARRLLTRGDIAEIVILAQEPAALLAASGTQWLAQEPRITGVAGGGSICDSLIAATEARNAGFPWLVTTADNVLLDDAMIDEFLRQIGGADLGASVVERRTLIAAYPESRRTWLRFRGGAYSGANLFWLGSPAARRGLEAWRQVEQDRKRARAVLRAFGWAIPVLAGLRLLTLRGAVRRVGRRLGLHAEIAVLPQPEACIDVDKPADHALVERILACRAAASRA